MSTPSREFAPWLGVFETLRVIDGRPLFLAWHRAELARAMEALGLASDADFVAEAANLPPKSGRWRWIVTREGTGVLFHEEPLMKPEPVRLSVSPVRVGSSNWDALFKTVSYLAHAQAAKLAGEGEAVLLNEAGDVASAARSNIFWVRGGKLYTPAHEAGCRCGVVRRFVIEQSPVEQGHFPLSELLEADQIFLTNSMRGIVPVREIGDRPLAAGSVAIPLRELYEWTIAR